MGQIISTVLEQTKKLETKDAYIFFENKKEKILSYGEFRRLIFSFYKELKLKNVKPEAIVILVGENSPKWPAAYFAANMLGLTVAHADTRFTENEFLNIHNFVNPALILCDQKFDNFFGSEIPKIFLEQVNPLEKSGEKEPEIIDLKDKQPMSIIFTSGTTGDPKGVMLSESNYLSNLKVFNFYEGMISDKDKIVGILPFYHVYPFLTTALGIPYVGATLILPRSLKGEDIFGALKKHGGTVLVAIPKVLEMFCEKIFLKIDQEFIFKKLMFKLLYSMSKVSNSVNINIGKKIFPAIHKNIPTLRLFACGGAKFDIKTHSRLKNLGLTIVEAYGLTETSPIAAINDFNNPRPGSVGKALPGAELKIEKRDPRFNHGEVCIKGPNVMMGYYKRPDLTNEVIRDGWFHSGDLGHIDEDGNLTITGRKKEVIVLSTGKNIYPDELEKMYSKPEIVDEICIVLMKRDGKEQLTAAVYPNKEFLVKNKVSSAYDVIRFELLNISHSLSAHQRINRIELFADSLPKTALGKLKRFKVEEILRSKRDHFARSDKQIMVTKEELEDTFLLFIKNVLRIKKFPKYDDYLETDLGLDSLEKMELFASIQKTFGVNLTTEQQVGILTVKDIKKLIPVDAEICANTNDNFWEEKILASPEIPLAKHVSIKSGLVGTTFRYLIHLTLRLILKLFFKASIKGLEHLENVNAPFVLAPNHKSLVDGLVIYGILPFKIVNKCFFMSLPQYFDTFPGVLVRKMIRIILTGTTDTSVTSLQYSYQVLRLHKIMCVFPEGERSIDNNVKEAKKGIGHVAKLANVPFVPVFIDGTEALFSRTNKGFKKTRIKVKVMQKIKCKGDVNDFLCNWRDLLQNAHANNNS